MAALLSYGALFDVIYCRRAGSPDHRNRKKKKKETGETTIPVSEFTHFVKIQNN